MSRARPTSTPLSITALFALLLLAAAACGDAAPTQPTGTPNTRPVAAFTASLAEGSAPLEVRFDASSSNDPDGSIVGYAWEFGDGGTGMGQTATHTYADAGSYTPRLTVTDDRGATHSVNGSPITVNSPPGTGDNEIAGTVWHDADGDGMRDPEEQPIEAIVVFLDENGNGMRDSAEVAAVTGEDGAYLFEGLDHRLSYTVTQQLTIGWTNTAPGLPEPDAAPGDFPVAGIIGGSEAEPGKYPFQVALITPGRFQFCGGTFIAADWVLTAAHCVEGAAGSPQAVKVLAGAHNKVNEGEVLDVERIFIHPAYSAGTFLSSDIALMKLTASYMYPRIELLAPERAALAAPGTIGTTIGWGLTSEGGDASDVLKELEAEIISNDECRTHLDNSIQNVTICAGKLGSTESICNGDSGGPLMVPFRDRWMQAGIVSFGTAICYQPSAYARVSALIDYPRGIIPPERSGAVVVDWKGGGKTAQVDFGNFR